MKPANFPVISTLWSLNQALLPRGAAFVMTANKIQKPRPEVNSQVSSVRGRFVTSLDARNLNIFTSGHRSQSQFSSSREKLSCFCCHIKMSITSSRGFSDHSVCMVIKYPHCYSFVVFLFHLFVLATFNDISF